MVLTFLEGVGDARLLALRGVVVALVSAGGAMGGGAKTVRAGVLVVMPMAWVRWRQ